MSRFDADEYLDGLTTRAREAAKKAYRERPERVAGGDFRHSQEDFYCGWIACLVWLHSRSSFAANRLPGE